MFTVRDIQFRYHVTQATVLQWIHSNQLKAINVGRPAGWQPRWRITEQQLTEFEAERESTNR
jgi:hypothetical protein